MYIYIYTHTPQFLVASSQLHPRDQSGRAFQCPELGQHSDCLRQVQWSII